MKRLDREIKKIVEAAIGEPVSALATLQQRILDQMVSHKTLLEPEVAVHMNLEDVSLWVCYIYRTKGDEDYTACVLVCWPD